MKVDYTDVSDTHGSATYGAGINWAPTTDLRFSIQGNRAQSSPSLQQLSAPVLVTPGVSVFDPLTGQSVLVTTTTGGNPALEREDQRD